MAGRKKIPHLINLIKSSLHFKTYPNVYYSIGQRTFFVYCPRKDSKDFTSANIKVFKDWDSSKKRKFDYSKARQRVLTALKKSIYLSFISSTKDIYEFRFNSSEEIAAKRKASKQKQVSGNYGSDGESMPPSSPELAPSPFDESFNYSSLDSSLKEMELCNQLPVLSTEVSGSSPGAFQDWSFVPMPSTEGVSFSASPFLETTGNQLSNSCSALSAMQPLYSVEIVDLGAEQSTYVGLEDCSSLMETCSKSVVAAEESTYTPYEFKELCLGDELANVPVNSDMNHLQTFASSGVEGEDMPTKSNEHLVAGTALQSNYGAPSSAFFGDAVQLKIDEVVTSEGDVTAYLISAWKVFGIPQRGPNTDSLNK